LLRELVLGSVKARLFLDYTLNAFCASGAKPPRKVMNLLRLGAYQLLLLSKIPPHAAVHETVELAKSKLDVRQVSFINAILRRIGREGAPSLPSEKNALVAYLSVMHSFPEWLVDRWLKRFGRDGAETMMHRANEAPPLVARVNALRGTRAEAVTWLKQNNVDVDLLEAPWAIQFSGVGNPGLIPGMEEGWLYFQDQASQWLCEILDPQPGETCIDWCSAPGGKTTHMAERMCNQGIIWAHDASEKKLKKVADNARRLGVTCIKTVLKIPENILADRVLVDAPCSGLGTLRRHAETRWRIHATDLARLADVQCRLLETASQKVKLGGILVYATCTTEPEENEEVVQVFLREHKEFILQPGPSSNGLPKANYWGKDGFFRSFPLAGEQDGMFVARMLRARP
jgi:16S rRNA (cytosine967-C5)-methyltransferase